MVPGFRYHVVTLAAIFLALGVGIVIGSSFVQSAIVEQQTRQLTALREQFNRDVQPLREENRHYDDALTTLVPALIQNRLLGSRVALIQTGDYPEAMRRVRETIEQAGGRVVNQTALSGQFLSRLQTQSDKLLARLQELRPNATADTRLVFQVLSEAVTQGSPREDFDALIDAGLLTREGDYSRGCEVVILVGGGLEEREGRVEAVDVPLVLSLRQQNATLLAVEPRSVGASYITALRGSDLMTIDDVDTDLGRLALVAAIPLARRGERGNFGVKETARSGVLPLFPAP